MRMFYLDRILAYFFGRRRDQPPIEEAPIPYPERAAKDRRWCYMTGSCLYDCWDDRE